MLKALSLETDVGGIVRSDLRSLFRLSVSFPVSSKVANSVDKLLKKKIKFCYEWCSIEISRFPDFPGSLDPARPGQSLSRPVPGISRPVLSIGLCNVRNYFYSLAHENVRIRPNTRNKGKYFGLCGNFEVIFPPSAF